MRTRRALYGSNDRRILECAVCVFLFICLGCGGGGTTAPALIAPTLTAAAPSQGPTAGGTALTLTGANFSAGATVTVGGIPASAVQVVDDTTITCNTPRGRRERSWT